MGLTNAANFILIILVEKRVLLGLRVRCPSVHRERQGDGGILIAVGKRARGIGAHQRIYQRHGLNLSRQRKAGAEAAQDTNRVEKFHGEQIRGLKLNRQGSRPGLVREPNPKQSIFRGIIKITDRFFVQRNGTG